MNYSHRFWLYGPVGLFAILIIAIMAYWWVAAGNFSKKLDALNGHDVVPGVHLSFTQKHMAGFPFRLDSELDGLSINIATPHGPARWTAEHFAMHSLTYDASKYIFEAAGKQALTWHDDSGKLHTYAFLPGALRASAVLEDHAVVRFDIDLLAADSPDVSAAHVELHLRRNPKIDALDLVASADAVHIAPDLEPAFGSDIRTLKIDAMISPGTSYDGLLAGHADWRATLENWRTRHGGVQVHKIEIDWGKLTISGKGAVTVDALHRPMGSLPLVIDNWRTLQKPQGDTPKASEGLRTALSAYVASLSAPTDKPITPTLTFKDGILFVGQMPGRICCRRFIEVFLGGRNSAPLNPDRHR